MKIWELIDLLISIKNKNAEVCLYADGRRFPIEKIDEYAQLKIASNKDLEFLDLDADEDNEY